MAKSKVSHSSHVLVEYIKTDRKPNGGVGGGGGGENLASYSSLATAMRSSYQINEKKKKTKAVCEQLRGGSLTTGDRSPDGFLVTRVILDVFDWRCI